MTTSQYRGSSSESLQQQPKFPQLLLPLICCTTHRIGTVTTTPWAFYERDDNGEVVKGLDGKPVLVGYCIEMIEELAKRMFFDYELVLPTDDSNMHGKK